MKALARRVKGGFSVGIGACAMIAMTCSMALGQATPDEPISVPEPSTLVVLATGLGLIGWFVWRKKRKAA